MVGSRPGANPLKLLRESITIGHDATYTRKNLGGFTPTVSILPPPLLRLCRRARCATIPTDLSSDTSARPEPPKS